MSNISFESWLEQILSFKPKKIDLYKRAFTHGSTGESDYQRLEFLGDRVLGLVISHSIYARFPNEPEGRLSQRLNLLVSGKTCAVVARNIGLEPYIKLGKQARDDGARDSDNVLGDITEALIGAIYIDQGLEKARGFIEGQWATLIGTDDAIAKHPKSDLQEWCASHNRKSPIYEIIDKSGPPHSTIFTVSVSVKGYDDIIATGLSKQSAQTSAAAAFLEKYT